MRFDTVICNMFVVYLYMIYPDRYEGIRSTNTNTYTLLNVNFLLYWILLPDIFFFERVFIENIKSLDIAFGFLLLSRRFFCCFFFTIFCEKERLNNFKILKMYTFCTLFKSLLATFCCDEWAKIRGFYFTFSRVKL